LSDKRSEDECMGVTWYDWHGKDQDRGSGKAGKKNSRGKTEANLVLGSWGNEHRDPKRKLRGQENLKKHALGERAGRGKETNGLYQPRRKIEPAGG